eukprot:m.209798 g.209798  ORF g.209798 m.209798 type:complete len:360 (-) comp24737_c0_seq1:118-1197(-)
MHQLHIRLLIVCMAAMIVRGGRTVTHDAVRLIIDTDMSGDCDDVGAVCIANALMDRGEAELVAVVHNTGLDTGVGAISAILTYYGRPNIPVGAYKGTFDQGLRGPYVDDLVQHFPTRIKRASEAPDAVTVYRSALAASPDHSVWISSIGFTTNLQALLQSGPDAISPLNGTALVARKCQGLAWMGGAYPSSASVLNNHPEHNFGYHCSVQDTRCHNMTSPPIGPSTQFVVQHWPSSVPITFLGFEIGVKIGTGGVMTNHTPATNPCRQAYIDHSGAGNDRASWDPATTLYAVRGAEGFYRQVFGHNIVNANGTNRFVASADASGSQSYLVQQAPVESVRDAINTLLLKAPANGPLNQIR